MSINTERTYRIIGKDQADAKFSVFPTGQLQIDFLHTFCSLRAPGQRLRFEPRLLAGSVETVRIGYEDGTDTLWSVNISPADAAELQEIMRNAAASLAQLQRGGFQQTVK